MNTTNKMIINFTPTGIMPTKLQTPYVPITPTEIIQQVKQAWDLGITMVHLHARDSLTGQSTYRKEVYEEIILGIRAFAPELIICVSTSGRVDNEVSHRSEVLTLEGASKPDMASLTLSSLNFNKVASINTPSLIFHLANEMKSRGIKPELEAFDLGMVNYARYLIGKDLLTPPYYFNIILGNIACAQGDLLHAGLMINELPPDSLFAIGGVGRNQLPMNSLALAMGIGVRVGLEDNLWYDTERNCLATNQSLLERIHLLIRANDKSLLSAGELRSLLQLNPGNGNYGMKEVSHV